MMTEIASCSFDQQQGVLADKTGHIIMADRPDFVMSAIRDVVEAAQHQTKLIDRCLS